MVNKALYYVWCDLDDARDMLTGISFRQTDYFREDAVQSAASHFYDNCDGWEWMKNGCTLYSVMEGDTCVFAHEVSVEFQPVFYASLGEKAE